MLPIKDNTTYLKKVQEYLHGFLDMNEQEFAMIANLLEVRQFPKKHRILDSGEVEDYFSIIIKGLARKYMITGKKEVTRQLALEGDSLLSELSFTERTPSQVIIETIEPCTLISIKYIDVEQLYIDLPKTEKLGRLIATDLFIKKDSQDFNNLNKTTRERFLEYVRSYPEMIQRVPQRYIASFLNIKPETFSRLKHLLRKRPSPGA